MRWTAAVLAWLIAFPSHATSVGEEFWNEADGIGFVPLTISNAVVGQGPSSSFDISQNFGTQALPVSLPTEIPDGILNYTPNLVFRVGAFGSLLPNANDVFPFFTRNGRVSANFSGTFSLFNNSTLIGTRNFNLFIPASGSCAGECFLEAFGISTSGPEVNIPTDQLPDLNLVLEFSDLVGTLGYDEFFGETNIVELTSQFDVRAHASFFFGPAPDPVSQVPLPPALLLFASACAALLGIIRHRGSGQATTVGTPD